MKEANDTGLKEVGNPQMCWVILPRKPLREGRECFWSFFVYHECFKIRAGV